MQRTLVGVALLTVLSMAGCATSFNGSAPAPDGSLYVVGSRQIPLPIIGPEPAIWSCPTKPGYGTCTRMQVIERVIEKGS